MGSRRALTALLLLTVAGCGPGPEPPGFGVVQEHLASRVAQQVHWRRGTPEDERVDERIDALLEAPLTAEAAVQIALLNNRDLQATYAQLGVSQAALVQAGLLRNPVFDASVGIPRGGGAVELGFGVVQDFLGVFTIPLRQSVARAELEAARWRVTAAVMDLAAATERAFYETQAGGQLIEMFEQVVAATGASAAAAGQLYEAGNITRLDLHHEQALHGQARLSLAAAHLAQRRDREHLHALMGLWGRRTEWTMAGRLPELPAEEPDPESVEQTAIANSIDLALARRELEATAWRLDLADATALVGDLEVGVEAEREEGAWEVGPTLSIPLPVFDHGQARVAAARAELQQRLERLHALAVDVRSGARVARDQVVTKYRIARFYRDEVLPLREHMTQETLLQYNAMQVGVFELLLAKQRQIEAGRSFVESLRDYWIARSTLRTILNGRLVPVDGQIETNGAAGRTRLAAENGGH